ncbi:MAG: acyl carrier protein [Clostridia bacterium]|nr:acyl carrier protein [Clostridia bacterium]
MMQDKIIKMIANKLSKKVEDVTLQSRLIEDLGADSLDIVELLMMLEDEYGITIPDQDAMKLSTIGDIVKFMESQNIK